MTKKLLPASCLGFALMLSSCIADEPLNSECDILEVDKNWLATQDYITKTPEVTNTDVKFTIKKGFDRSALNPSFIVTQGATISDNGAMLDFSQPQTYRVTSEDRKYFKDYTVSFTYAPALNIFSFENVETEKNSAGKELFNLWYEIDDNGDKQEFWATGNPGYKLSGQAKNPSQYPTASVEGYKNKGVKLTTCSTGSFGMQTRPRMPIAAGSIFIGNFNSAKAVSKPREATTFGLPMQEECKPLRLEGYYKYTAGTRITDQSGAEVVGAKELCDIYSVVYEIDPNNFVPLNGDDVLTSERIVLMARIDEPGEPKDWLFFSEEFKEKNGKTFSEEKAKKGEYAIAVVATSSREGAYFTGAVGSTLYVDEIKIKWEK